MLQAKKDEPRPAVRLSKQLADLREGKLTEHPQRENLLVRLWQRMKQLMQRLASSRSKRSASMLSPDFSGISSSASRFRFRQREYQQFFVIWQSHTNRLHCPRKPSRFSMARKKVSCVSSSASA